MLVGVLGGIVIVLAGYGVGSPVRRWLLPEWVGWRALLAGWPLGMAILSPLNLVLTGLGWYRPGVVIPLIGIAAIAGVAGLVRDPPPLPPLPRWATSVPLLILAFAFLCGLAGSLAPETQYDATFYHLAFPDLWLRTGHLTFVPWNFTSGYPFGTELNYGDAFAIGGAVSAKFVNLTYGAILTGAIADIGSRLYSGRVGLLAAALSVLSPLILWEATTADVDLAGAALMLMMVDVALACAAGTRTRRSVMAVGLLAGSALSTKLISAYVFPLVWALFIYGNAMTNKRRALRDCLIMTAMAVVLVTPYLVRAVILTGSPVPPYFTGLFPTHRSFFDATNNGGLNAVLRAFGEGHGILALLAMPVTLADGANNGFGDGALPGLIPLGVLLAASRHPRRLPMILGLGALSYTLLWFWVGQTLQARYMIAGYALFAPIAAAGLCRLYDAIRSLPAGPRRAGLLAMAVAATAIAVLPSEPWTGWSNQQMRTILYSAKYDLGAYSKWGLIERIDPGYNAELAVDRLARPGDRVMMATNLMDTVNTTVPQIPYFDAMVSDDYGHPGSFLREANRLHIRWVILGPGIGGWNQFAFSNTSWLESNWRWVYYSQGYNVYELRHAHFGRSTQPY